MFHSRLPESSSYKSHFRELIGNLSHPDNEELRRKIREGELTTQQLIRMKTVDLAPSTLLKEREKEKLDALKSVVVEEKDVILPPSAYLAQQQQQLSAKDTNNKEINNIIQTHVTTHRDDHSEESTPSTVHNSLQQKNPSEKFEKEKKRKERDGEKNNSYIVDLIDSSSPSLIDFTIDADALMAEAEKKTQQTEIIHDKQGNKGTEDKQQIKKIKTHNQHISGSHALTPSVSVSSPPPRVVLSDVLWCGSFSSPPPCALPNDCQMELRQIMSETKNSPLLSSVPFTSLPHDGLRVPSSSTLPYVAQLSQTKTFGSPYVLLMELREKHNNTLNTALNELIRYYTEKDRAIVFDHIQSQREDEEQWVLYLFTPEMATKTFSDKYFQQTLLCNREFIIRRQTQNKTFLWGILMKEIQHTQKKEEITTSPPLPLAYCKVRIKSIGFIDT